MGCTPYQDGSYKAGVTINTGYIPTCRSLSNEDKKKFISERKNHGVKLGDWKGNKTGNELDRFKELKKQNSRFKRNIKALKKKVTNNNDEGYDNYKP